LLPWAAFVLVAVAWTPATAEAVEFRRPHNVAIGVNYGRDDDGGAAGCDDYQCGSVCYDGHSGTDFGLPLGTTVVAVADGVVSATYNGCANYGGLGNTCGGRCGNYVRIDHADGMRSLYCHLQLNSITVSTNQSVSCGDVIGRSASSGNSSGPHLHLGTYVNGVTRDPFAGSCSQSTSYWTNQGSYPHPLPSTACENPCQCSPGATQTQGCGNCGTRQRSCSSNCLWGSWSACTGQGECPAGAVDTRPCCDCGTETRQCSAACAWQAWSPCSGPDPSGGTEECATGEPGLCAEGRVRCVEGCLGCVSEYEPQPELCDGTDEDCTGVADDGFPAEMGDPPPELAARFVDASFPHVLERGERARVWATFRNEGQLRWSRQAMWLVATSTWNGESSPLHDSDSWAAHDVAAVCPHDVEPGGVASFEWTIRATDEPDVDLEETFRLVHADGTIIDCPEPRLFMAIRSTTAQREASDVDSLDDSGAADPAAPEASTGCGCRSATGPARPSFVTLLALLALVPFRRTRSRSS
jgi:MYXO-CTERM domain-containing protein